MSPIKRTIAVLGMIAVSVVVRCGDDDDDDLDEIEEKRSKLAYSISTEDLSRSDDATTLLPWL